ncbi:exosome complex component RRP42-like [Littorina saxatilis]|uniref:Ribosomal RNA-processing protein 42 n=1 Tax=Littorina saxatilis TaxID=31220 RepID=A0AAN9C1E5_9CAEN
MVDVNLSEAEKTFIVHGIQDNFREDGRSNEEYRQMDLETGLMSNTSGSARLRLANTEILVGVKAELEEPKPEKPDVGRLEFFVDCSANAAPEFEGRGGEELATEMMNLLYRAYSASTVLDVSSLCLQSGKLCWVLYVDVLLLECGGNLFDAASIAVKAALFNTKIPSVKVRQEEGEETELEVSDDPYDVRRLDVSAAPTVLTLSKIGHNHIVDASQKEEACCLARLMMAVTASGSVTATVKEGRGSLDPDSITEMMQVGKRVGKAVNEKLLETLKEEEQKGLKRKTVGFLR